MSLPVSDDQVAGVLRGISHSSCSVSAENVARFVCNFGFGCCCEASPVLLGLTIIMTM